MKVSIKLFLLSVLFIFFSGNLSGSCEETGCHESVRRQPQGMGNKIESDENVGAWFASLYRDHISRVDSDRCPSIPTCASYSAMAFRKHGLFVGWLMTVDRLIHEGDERSVSPVVYHEGGPRTLDPVENNDFWWFRNDGSTQK
jgi:hypothetical protein